jgi:hypothetical protein
MLLSVRGASYRRGGQGKVAVGRARAHAKNPDSYRVRKAILPRMTGHNNGRRALHAFFRPLCWGRLAQATHRSGANRRGR